MTDPLLACIERFGAAPRSHSLWERYSYLRVPKPKWLRPLKDDQLNLLFQYMDELCRNGTVVWGHLIQVNSLMFLPGKANCPGEVVYSLDHADRANPDYLKQVAHKLFELKGTPPNDAALEPIAKYLTDEMIRVFGLPVPTQISPGAHCRISSTLFVREHLPGGRILSPWFPIIAKTDMPHVVLPLPVRYWPRQLIAKWVTM